MSEIQATWYAVRVSGAWPHEAEYIYTSADPPVEAAKYERMKQRAEAAEAALAAAPLAALRTAVDLAQVAILHRMDRGAGADAAAVAAAARWLAERGEGQP